MKAAGWTRIAIIASALVVLAASACLIEYLVGDGDNAARPIIIALGKYRQRNGVYPLDLQDLADGGLVASIPSAPSSLSKSRNGYYYFVDRELDLFCLSYSERDWFGGLGPARATSRGYASYDGIWFGEFEQGMEGFPHPLTVVMPKAGERFRESRSIEYLDLFVRKISEYSHPDKESMFQKEIMEEEVAVAIGKGRRCEIAGYAGICYEPDEASAIAYLFETEEVPSVRQHLGGKISRIFRVDRSQPSAVICSEVYLAK